jgi:hypothetical protein
VRKTWTRRWFELKADKKLRYFKQQFNSGKHAGEIDLNLCTVTSNSAPQLSMCLRMLDGGY